MLGRNQVSAGFLGVASDGLCRRKEFHNLVRRTKKLSDVDVEFVCKKWRTPSFAAGVKRDVVAHGAELLNISFERPANETLKALQASADKLGL